jgi:hypothetical protein
MRPRPPLVDPVPKWRTTVFITGATFTDFSALGARRWRRESAGAAGEAVLRIRDQLRV